MVGLVVVLLFCTGRGFKWITRGDSNIQVCWIHGVVHIVSGSSSVHLVTVYRPAPSSQNKLTTFIFFTEFSDFLEAFGIYRNLVALSDFNIHWYKSDNDDWKKFSNLLNLFVFGNTSVTQAMWVERFWIGSSLMRKMTFCTLPLCLHWSQTISQCTMWPRDESIEASIAAEVCVLQKAEINWHDQVQQRHHSVWCAFVCRDRGNP